MVYFDKMTRMLTSCCQLYTVMWTCVHHAVSISELCRHYSIDILTQCQHHNAVNILSLCRHYYVAFRKPCGHNAVDRSSLCTLLYTRRYLTHEAILPATIFVLPLAVTVPHLNAVFAEKVVRFQERPVGVVQLLHRVEPFVPPLRLLVVGADPVVIDAEHAACEEWWVGVDHGCE